MVLITLQVSGFWLFIFCDFSGSFTYYSVPHAATEKVKAALILDDPRTMSHNTFKPEIVPGNVLMPWEYTSYQSWTIKDLNTDLKI